MATLRKACFLDRDGVLIEEENYLSDPARARLCDGVVKALARLHASGYLLVVVSNQSGVARGYFTMRAVEAVQSRIAKLLAGRGVVVDAWYNCPHHPEGSVPELAIDCECRKPKPGMLLKAAQDLGIDLKASFMIGDRLSDIEAAFNAGCPAAALVATGHGSEQDLSNPVFKRAVLARNASDAVEQLLRLPLDICPSVP